MSIPELLPAPALEPVGWCERWIDLGCAECVPSLPSAHSKADTTFFRDHGGMQHHEVGPQVRWLHIWSAGRRMAQAKTARPLPGEVSKSPALLQQRSERGCYLMAAVLHGQCNILARCSLWVAWRSLARRCSKRGGGNIGSGWQDLRWINVMYCVCPSDCRR